MVLILTVKLMKIITHKVLKYSKMAYVGPIKIIDQSSFV